MRGWSLLDVGLLVIHQLSIAHLGSFWVLLTATATAHPNREPNRDPKHFSAMYVFYAYNFILIFFVAEYT